MAQLIRGTYAVDVANYQLSDLTAFRNCGAKLAIVKVSEGTTYQNPKGRAQIASAKSLGMSVAGYFFATFSNNASAARLQAQYAVATAKSMGLPFGSYLATDWEKGTGGSYNNVEGDPSYNTQAILVTMDVIKESGYKPLLYSGADLLRRKINTKQILAKYPNSLWVASYPTMSPVKTANMAYFPSMDGVAIWQFTSDWYGLSVDANYVLIDDNASTSNADSEVDEDMVWHPEVDIDDLGRFKVTNPSGAYLYTSNKLNEIVKESGSDAVRKAGQVFRIYKASNGAVLAGKSKDTEQWFSQSDGVTKINPLKVNDKASSTTCVVVEDGVYTQNDPKPSAGITKVAKGSTWKVYGRTGKFLIIGSEKTGKYIDGTKCKVILY